MSLLKTLASLLDRPSINWKLVIFGFTTAKFLFEGYLTFRQYQVLKRKEPLPELKDVVEEETFEKSQAYGRSKALFSIASSVYSFAQFIPMIYFNVNPWLWDLSGRLLGSSVLKLVPLLGVGEISQSIVFMGLSNVISTVFALPLAAYSTFVLEEKYGFNKQTVKLFIIDNIKSFVLTNAIGSPLLAVFLKIVKYFGDSFFYYVWLFMLAFQIAAITLYPVLIQPLFNKLTPLPEGELKSAIEALAEKNKFPLTKLYEIDGSKRSSHSNAYFYGTPWSKQIVIYDTLIEQSTVPEVTAVLGHEIGHWALNHTTKMLIVTQVHLFGIFGLFSAFIHNSSLYQSFGFAPGVQPILVGFSLFSDILQPLETVMTYAMNVMSRRFEYQADEYAVKQGYAADLKKSLIKLHVKNLSSMHVDPYYSSYHYSHPTLPERLKVIDEFTAAEKKQE